MVFLCMHHWWNCLDGYITVGRRIYRYVLIPNIWINISTILRPTWGRSSVRDTLTILSVTHKTWGRLNGRVNKYGLTKTITSTTGSIAINPRQIHIIWFPFKHKATVSSNAFHVMIFPTPPIPPFAQCKASYILRRQSWPDDGDPKHSPSITIQIYHRQNVYISWVLHQHRSIISFLQDRSYPIKTKWMAIVI